MSGTKAGARKAAQTNIERYGADFYGKIGSFGGSRGTTGGFASQKKGKDGLTGQQRARLMGAKGGRLRSKRGPAADSSLTNHSRRRSHQDA